MGSRPLNPDNVDYWYQVFRFVLYALAIALIVKSIFTSGCITKPSLLA